MKFGVLRNLNKFERIFIVAFTGSIVAGIINGMVDTSYFQCCEDAIGIPEEGTSVLKIFTSNFMLSLTELFTMGISSLYYNFHTFSVTTSYLSSQGALYMLLIILLIGSFELVGSLCMALTGFGFVEKKLFKIKSKIDYKTLFFYGVSLIFIGAAIEYLLLKPLI